MRRVVLTSFEPFDGHALNSSLEVGRALLRRPPDGVVLDWVVLPVVAGHCVEQAWARVRRAGPALVLSLGQHAGAAALRLEDVAVNLNDFRIDDNAGNRPRRQRILPAGPPAYRTTLCPTRLLRALRGRGIRAERSGSAGTYVCNHLFYGLLHRAAVAGCPHQTGFIHLPLLPGQTRNGATAPTCELEELVEGVRLAIRASLAPDG
jgi:pyroglutamyl-peptidase